MLKNASSRSFKIRPFVVALGAWSFWAVAWAQSSAPAQAAPSGEQRKTSEPYTGDLSIFDSPGREERLQINRVMDILGITRGESCGRYWRGVGMVHGARGEACGRGRHGLCGGH